MAERELCYVLRDFARDVLKGTAWDEFGKCRAPKVVDSFIPPRTGVNNSTNYPILVVRPIGGRTGQQGGLSVRVAMMVGVESEDIDGFSYCLHVLQVLRTALLALPYSWIQHGGDCYLLDRESIEWQLPEDQPYPYWELEIFSTWTIGGVTRPDPFGQIRS